MSKIKSHIFIISGIDGSGKSTIINELKKNLQQRGGRIYTPWLRYNHYSTRVVFALAKLLGFYGYDIQDGRRVASYHEFSRSRLISVLFIAATYIDTLLASLLKVHFPAYILRRIVICDRWVPDILVDIAVDTGKKQLGKDFVWKMFWGMVPTSAKAFVIMRERGEVLACREENRISRDFEIRFKLYEDLCTFGPVHTIDNCGAMDQAVRQVLEVAL
ncbi:MAG: hypothetical protein JXM70_19275 [Pirellulales bacterium]|nr:hypothetical protein [Pirellulales bacterium]